MNEAEPEVRPKTYHLEYQAPFAFEVLLAHYRTYRVGCLETFTPDRMQRLVDVDGRTGWIIISDDPTRSRLEVTIDPVLVPHASAILKRVRSMFDLDLNPRVVQTSLAVSPEFTRLLALHPGLRVPTGWDPYEIAIGTILGQLVSVDRARALTADLIELLGRDSGHEGGSTIKLFPRPSDVAESDLVGLGTTGARKHTLREFSRRVVTGELSLAPDQDPIEFVAQLRSVRGIGPWTASYVAMKVLRDTDAFPATDLILARALEIHPPSEIERMRPWRAYAAILLWREYALTLKKTKGVTRESKTKR